jgi:hypothetical protein
LVLHPKGEHKLRVFENKMPKRIFGPKREEVTAKWIQLHNDKIHNFSFPNIIVVIKPVRMTWEKHIVHMG